MLPPLTADGVLPPGIHLTTLHDLSMRFGVDNPVRRDVARRLDHILQLAGGTSRLKRVFVWGSLVTAKPEPGDVDLMLGDER